MRASSAAVVAAATAFTVGALALPAHADQYNCGTWKYSPSGLEYFQVCTWETYYHDMYGTFEYLNSTNLSQGVTGTIIVQRCQVGGVNCTTITAQHLDMWVYAHDGETWTTSSKPGSYGWVYRTCVSADSTSGWSFVFSCSTWNAYNP